jgi:hypothetical protein
MTYTEATAIIADSKPLARTIHSEYNYTLNPEDRQKLYSVEDVVKAGFTRNDSFLLSAGLSRFDLAVLLGAIYILKQD